MDRLFFHTTGSGVDRLPDRHAEQNLHGQPDINSSIALVRYRPLVPAGILTDFSSGLNQIIRVQRFLTAAILVRPFVVLRLWPVGLSIQLSYHAGPQDESYTQFAPQIRKRKPPGYIFVLRRAAWKAASVNLKPS
ncbi:hypothetical protein M3484_04595 [Pseudomonas sp. GX19020]|uniref:hypothetical protein n=1 Tax=Pseudomonas sp. GX19020 TaxID=2942277 RepID=UPI002018F80C|nr:hypothetical protein [Pseudomonas sp. GX19020]MCL4065842.1 hypothetical protein [Pseudomonas sp. GX19020]